MTKPASPVHARVVDKSQDHPKNFSLGTAGSALPESRRLRWIASAPIIPIAVALIFLWLADWRDRYQHPYLLLLCNMVFLALGSLSVFYLMGKNFLLNGRPHLLLVGCGALSFSIASVLSVALGSSDPNTQISIYNSTALLAAACHFLGALASRNDQIRFRIPWIWLLTSCLFCVSIIIAVSVATMESAYPVFFVQGEGGTTVRYVVLGSAALLFLLTAVKLFLNRTHPWRGFRFWYSLALVFLAIGLMGVLGQKSHDSLLGWVARASQYIGGIYMFVAALSSARETKAWSVNMQAALSDAEQHTRDILHTISEGMIVLGADWRFVYVNPAAERIIRKSSEDLLGESIWALFPEAENRLFGREYRRAMAEKETVCFEEYYPAPLDRWYECRAYPGDNGLTVFFNDVTERRQAREALEAAQEALRAHADSLEKTVASRTEKLRETVEELEHFSYAIVHDLRAPLRALQSFATLMQEEHEEGQPLNAQYLQRIRIAARRMDQLVTDSLNYSKAVREHVTLGTVDLDELISGIVSTYPNFQNPDFKIIIEHPLPKVIGNEAALTQCFSNLLGNAVKFVPPGRSPMVRVRAEPVAGSRTTRIWVEDNGIGIPPEFRDRIFEMFERATKDYEGTGIGLAIVRKVVLKMGGKVGVESTPGQSSRFWVELQTPNEQSPLLPPPTGDGVAST